MLLNILLLNIAKCTLEIVESVNILHCSSEDFWCLFLPGIPPSSQCQNGNPEVAKPSYLCTLSSFDKEEWHCMSELSP